jgi:predicted chitinase
MPVGVLCKRSVLVDSLSTEGEMPNNAPPSLDERKFELEKQKFEFDKSKSHGFGFLNNNLGIVITAIIGAATITVSYLQLEISKSVSKAQLDLQKAISDAQIGLERTKAQAEKDKDERKFQFDVASLLLEKQSAINTNDLRQIYYMRDIVMSTLPSEISIKITSKMADNASDDRIRSAWADGNAKLELSVSSASAPAPKTAISFDFLVSKFPQLNTKDARERIADILKALNEFKIDDAQSRVFLALVLYDTNFFSEMVENLDYSASRIIQLWPARFPTLSEANQYAGKPELLANKVYANRMGNVEPDDGWKFRGRGYMSTTGRANYAKSSGLIGIDLIANPDALLQSSVAAREAAAVFSKYDLKPDDLQGALRQVQGGFAGLADVRAIYVKLTTG